jgi:alkylated DNA repair protein alkB family protein 7
LILVGARKIDTTDKKAMQILDELWVLPEFITPSEEDQLLEEINPMFKKKRYIDTHWDGVITGYKEIEKMMWKPQNAQIIQRVRQLLPSDTKWRPAVHVLDLAANGPIDAHIDSVTASGGILAGLSLSSSCVMTLKRENFEPIQILLRPRTLYVMQGDIRYEYTHEIPANESLWGQEKIPRDRRISIMFRDELPAQANPGDGVRLFKLTEDGAISL